MPNSPKFLSKGISAGYPAPVTALLLEPGATEAGESPVPAFAHEGLHHGDMVAALGTALHGATNLATSQMHLRCGLDGRAPVATAVPHAVATLCRRLRRCLPRQMWLRGCGLFVRFIMAGLTRHKPLTAGACPHKKLRLGGTDFHAVNTCVRCSGMAHIFAALREEIKDAVEV